MRTLSTCAGLMLSLLLGLGMPASLSHTAAAQTYDVPPTWGGDLISRSRLTGDWGGLRDDLGKKGIVFDADLLLSPQYIISGGRNTGGIFWGNADYTLNIDSSKLGLWPDGFFKVEADTGFGTNVFRDIGGLVPVKTNALLPGLNRETSALTNLTLTQFFGPQLGLFAGKINTLDLGKTEFYGDYMTQFENAAFNFPITINQVPFSAFGGGVLVFPRQDFVLSALALDPSGNPLSNDIGKAFSDGVMVVGSGQLTSTPFNLVDHQRLGFTWSDKKWFSLTQDPTNIAHSLINNQFPRLADPGTVLTGILERFFPNLLAPAQPANRLGTSWSFTYSFDQYFWQPEGDPKRGFGMFFAFGVSDGNPNPVKYSYLIGLGGKGAMPGRTDDNFGIGFARTDFSSDFVPFLRQRLNLGLQHEDAVEMYYNAAITSWLNATADLQIVNPALNRALNSVGQLTSVDIAVIAGTRLRIRF